jgi:osmoprotectant transport system permease protein
MINAALEHLFLVFVTVIFSTLIGVPLGILAYFNKTLRKIILTSVDIMQTIPSLATLGIIMVFFGSGKLTTIVGLTLYSLLAIVNSTYVGFNNIAPEILEAAKGIGMDRKTRLFKLMLPLSVPMIFSGIKISTVTAVGTAVFGTFVGGGGLGGIINRGIRIQNMEMIIKGMLLIMAMSLGLDAIMTKIEDRLNAKYKNIG